MAVDDFDPNVTELEDIIKRFPDDHMTTNLGPLYICLIGHGAEDCFQIMPNEVITARELKESIDKFQNLLRFLDNWDTLTDIFHYAGTLYLTELLAFAYR